MGIVKLEMTENEEFLMNLDDKDYMYAAIDQEVVKKSDADGDSEENDDQDDEDDFSEFTESEEEEEEDEYYDEEMKGIVSAGFDDGNKTPDIVQEVMALKFSFKYKTFSDTALSCLRPIFEDFIDRYLSTLDKIGRRDIPKLMETLGNWQPLFIRLIPEDNDVLQLISVIEFLCIEQEKLK